MAGIYQHSPIKVASLKGGNKCFCGCDVGCNGYVVKIAKAEKLVVDCSRSRGRTSISEVQKYVNLVIGYAGSYLLLAALFTGHEFVYLKSCGIGDVFCSCSGSG